jgi:hypothetical protein
VTGIPRRAASILASSTSLSSRGPAISMIRVGSTEDSAASATTSATVRAETIWVRISGTVATSPRVPHSSNWATNSWNCATWPRPGGRAR